MKTELKRQFLHVLFGSVMIAVIIFLGMQPALMISLAVLLIGFSLSSLVKKRGKLPWIHKPMKAVERGHETSLPGIGALTFFLGITLAVFLFQFNPAIAIGALCVLVYGDSAATIVGKGIGKHPLPNNLTWEGSLSGVVVSFVFLSTLFPLGAAFAAAVAGMSMELIELDDNLSIPVVSGLALTLLI